jgi:hypothetical protein
MALISMDQITDYKDSKSCDGMRMWLVVTKSLSPVSWTENLNVTGTVGKTNLKLGVALKMVPPSSPGVGEGGGAYDLAVFTQVQYFV